MSLSAGRFAVFELTLLCIVEREEEEEWEEEWGWEEE